MPRRKCPSAGPSDPPATKKHRVSHRVDHLPAKEATLSAGEKDASTAEAGVSIATLQQEILALLGSRANGKTCCPSEIPRLALKLPGDLL